MSQAPAGPGDPAAASFDVLVFYSPREATTAVLAAVFAAGAGTMGDYAECAFVAEGLGQFRPLPGATPSVGVVGRLERVPEHRVEVVVPAVCREAVVAALLAAHPYDVPAWHLLATPAWPPGRVSPAS